MQQKPLWSAELHLELAEISCLDLQEAVLQCMHTATAGNRSRATYEHLHLRCHWAKHEYGISILGAEMTTLQEARKICPEHDQHPMGK